MTDVKKAITCTYFTLTTLTTIGFGDLKPMNTNERVFSVLNLLFGVMIFSAILGSFMDMLEKMHQSTNDGNNLEKFFGMLKSFNGDRPINEKFKYGIESYFNYIWINNRNNIIETKSDISIF